MTGRFPKDEDCTREQLIEKLTRLRENTRARNINDAHYQEIMTKRISDLTRAKRLANRRADEITAAHRAFLAKLEHLTMEKL